MPLGYNHPLRVQLRIIRRGVSKLERCDLRQHLRNSIYRRRHQHEWHAYKASCDRFDAASRKACYDVNARRLSVTMRLLPEPTLCRIQLPVSTVYAIQSRHRYSFCARQRGSSGRIRIEHSASHFQLHDCTLGYQHHRHCFSALFSATTHIHF